jgi:hypothetical protein
VGSTPKHTIVQCHPLSTIPFTIRSGKTFLVHLKPGCVETPPLLGRKAERHGLSGESNIKVFIGGNIIYGIWCGSDGWVKLPLCQFISYYINNHSKYIIYVSRMCISKI